MNKNTNFIKELEQLKNEAFDRTSLIKEYQEKVINPLKKAGFIFEHTWELHDNKEQAENAMKFFCTLLDQDMHPVNKRDLVFYLQNAKTTKTKRIAMKRLLELFRENVDINVLGQAAVAIMLNVQKGEDFEEIKSLLHDPRNKKWRVHFTEALAKTKDPRAFDEIITYINDSAALYGVLRGLSLLKDLRGLTIVERFINYENSEIRNEAKKALAAFDKVEAKAKEKE